MLIKNTLIKIKKSFGRYFSLFLIVMVGVGFLAGLQATAPNMIDTSDRYFKEHYLMDYKIVSTMGLTDEDVSALKDLRQIQAVFPSYSLDTLAQNQSIRIHAIEESVNTVELIDGRMPQNEQECVADSRNYQIGDQIRITGDVSGKLKNTEFTVVGTINSVLYLADDYGNTSVGDGKLSSYAFIDKDNFTMEAYTELYIVSADTENTVAYSPEYDTAAQQLHEALTNIKSDRETARYREIVDKANTEISNNEIRFNSEKTDGERKLADAKAQLDENRKKLNDAKSELTKNELDLQQGARKQETEFAAAKVQIANGWNEIETALTQYGMKKDEISSKLDTLGAVIESMKLQLSQLPPGSPEYTQLSGTIVQYSSSYEGLSTLNQSIEMLTVQEAELNTGIKTFDSEIANAEKEIKNGKRELIENEKKLNDGYAEYNKNAEQFQNEIADAKEKIEAAKKDLMDIENPKWHIFDREASVGYEELKPGIDVVDSVASVFPLFFILIVVLMTSNSMARMIAEERSELGALTSLGYGDSSIIFTYLLYVLSASGLGTAAGFFIGCGIIPQLIYSNFQFILPPLPPRFNRITFLLILTAALLLMALVTISSCYQELRQKPSNLMRPVPPVKGKTTLIEKVVPVWKRLSFTWKITIRNMFRYKKRAVMTIVGVAGCASFLLTGFGLKDSMNGVAEKQYGEIFRYNTMTILKEDTQTIGGELERILTQEKTENPLLLKQTSLQCQTGDKSLDIVLVVPENEEGFSDYFHLKNKSQKSGEPLLALEDNGAIISQKLAEEWKAGKGDRITVKDSDNNEYQLTVSGVAENYMSNYMYMNSTVYNEVFQKPLSYNTIVLNHTADEKALAETLIDSGVVLNVTFTADILQKAIDSSKSLNSIILLIVVVSSLLALIVLYNLTSINISERKREIATLKVLGFTDGETNGYIYREAIILTLISIGAGLVLGILLHGFVAEAVEDYAPLFIKQINWSSFILSGVLTVLFSAVMQILTYFKLRTIDMIESLKSVE